MLAAGSLAVAAGPDDQPSADAEFTTQADAPKPADPATTDNDQPVPEKKPSWRLQFEPSAWYAGLSGRIRIAGAPVSAGQVEVTDLHLDNPRLTPAGELHVRTGNWRFSLGTFFFNQNRLQTMAVGGQEGAVTFVPGDQVSSKVTWDSYEPVVGYEIWSRDPQPGDNMQFGVNAEVFGGVRMDDVKFSFAQGALSSSQTEFFAQPLIGIKGSMEIAEKFTIDLEGSLSGWSAGSTLAYGYDITVGFMWRPIPNVGVQIGYRNLFNQLRRGDDSDRFQYSGALAGIFFGAVIRF